MVTDEQLRAHLQQSLDVFVRGGYGDEATVLAHFEEQVRDEYRNASNEEREREVSQRT